MDDVLAGTLQSHGLAGRALPFLISNNDVQLQGIVIGSRVADAAHDAAAVLYFRAANPAE